MTVKPHLRARTDAFVPSAAATSYHSASPIARDVKAWLPSRGRSADSDLTFEVGLIRDRSRDIERNSGIARGGIQTVVDNVVGTGLRLSARPDYRALGQTKEWADAWSAKVESLWCSWAWTTACDAADSMTWDQIAQQTLRAQLLNGAAVAISQWIPDRGDGFATKLQTVEVDRLSNPNGRPDSTTLRGGVELDPAYGMPLAYWVRKAHPGDIFLGDATQWYQWERVPRKTDFGRLRVLHVFDRDRPGQTIGKPVLSAILPQFKNLDRYTQAEIQAAVVNAMVAGVITTPLEHDEIVDLFSKDRQTYLRAREEHAVHLESGALLPLFPGDKLEPFLPSRPATAFGPFVENIYRIMAVGGFDMPYELLIKDFSKTNYSSARAAMLEAWRSFNRRRDALGTMFCDQAYALLLEELVNDGRVDAPGFYENRFAYQRCKWIGPGRGWVDPVKEAQAAALRIDSNLSTLEDECAEQGRDWHEVLEQRASEIEEMRRLNIPSVAPTATRVSTTETSDGGDTSSGQPSNDGNPQQQGGAQYAA